MKFTILPVFAVAMATATSVAAQGVEYLSYGASYTNLSADGGSIDLLSMGGSIDFRSNNAFVNGTFSFADVSSEEFDESIVGLSARGGLFVSPAAVVYGGLNYANASGGGSFSTYNIGGEYGFGAVTVGLNFDDSDETGYDDSTTLYASYRASNALEVAVGFTDTDGANTSQIGLDYDDGQYEINALFADSDSINLFGIDASYDFGNNFRASGNYVNFDGDADIFAVGAGYEVSQDLWVDLDLGRISVNGEGSIDVIGLALTYEMGNETLLIDRAETSQIESLGVLGQIASLGGFDS